MDEAQDAKRVAAIKEAGKDCPGDLVSYCIAQSMDQDQASEVFEQYRNDGFYEGRCNSTWGAKPE